MSECVWGLTPPANLRAQLPPDKRPCLLDLAFAQLLIGRASGTPGGMTNYLNQRGILEYLRAALKCPETRVEAEKYLRAGGWGMNENHKDGASEAVELEEEDDEL